jgi:hypothetical protein
VTVLAGEYLGDRGDVESVSAPELATDCRAARWWPWMRPEVEYVAGHIAGVDRHLSRSWSREWAS